MSSWYFRRISPGEVIREPIHGEFFASDAISDPGIALVREGIQNALDAGNDDGTVLVRIYLPGDDGAVSSSDAAQFFESAWEHFQTPRNGLNLEAIPGIESPCSFLLFEDFGTKGLEGDPREGLPTRQRSKNHFYHFFRAEGQSDKDTADRGSWGVGKHVFFRSSQISTVFGLTVRADDKKRMLMGKSVLKLHAVGSGDHCEYQDGYFGMLPSEDHPLVLPVEDADVLDHFTTMFQLLRGNNDPGLSLVIPWPDPEITEKRLISAILRDYFYPILNSQLEVIVETPSVKTVFDADNILGEAAKLDPQMTDNLRPLIELAAWAGVLKPEDHVMIKPPDPDRAWQWSSSLLSEEQLEELRENYRIGNKLAISVPVTVRYNNGEATPSFFNTYLVRDSSEQMGRPTFIRDGIIVTDVSAPRTRGVRAIVVVTDTPLAGFLRKAENPSHTQWHHTRLKEDYRIGYKTDLEFVKRSIHELVHILTKEEEVEDLILFKDFFSIPAPPDEEETVEKKLRKGGEKEGTEPPIPEPPIPRPKRFRIQKIRGGFSVLPGENGGSPPDLLEIRVAYDIRRGNPLKKYKEADFRMDELPIQLNPEPRNLTIMKQEGNCIEVAVNDPDYVLFVTGFDENRQIYVKVVPREVSDGNS